MTEHRWSGWPGAYCLDCGAQDPREIALADGNCTDEGLAIYDKKDMECPEPGSDRHNPYMDRKPL